MIWVEVAYQDAANVTPEIEAHARRAGFPGRPAIRIVEARIQKRPAIRAFDHVRGDEPERDRHGNLKLVDTIGYPGGFPDGLRSEPGRLNAGSVVWFVGCHQNGECTGRLVSRSSEAHQGTSRGTPTRPWRRR